MSVQTIGKTAGVYLARLITACVLLLTALSWAGVLLAPTPQRLSTALLLSCIGIGAVLLAYGYDRVR